jgi:hypothetical protein
LLTPTRTRIRILPCSPAAQNDNRFIVNKAAIIDRKFLAAKVGSLKYILVGYKFLATLDDVKNRNSFVETHSAILEQ